MLKFSQRFFLGKNAFLEDLMDQINGGWIGGILGIVNIQTSGLSYAKIKGTGKYIESYG